VTGLVGAVANGVGAGVVATIAMSVPMLAADKLGLMPEPPPEKITEDAMTAVGIEPADRTERQENALATVTHVAFGASCGVVFALVRRRLGMRAPAWLQGIPFGLGVWAVSYKGWVPALGILPPPEHDRPSRVRTMIAAHVVYGVVLGAVEGRGQRRQRYRGRSHRVTSRKGV